MRPLALSSPLSIIKSDSSALTALANADQKIQPSLQPLQVLRLVDLICHLWQQYVTDVIFPLASASVTVRRDMVVFNNQTVSRIEGAANAFLQKMIDGEFTLSDFCSLRPITRSGSAIVAWLSAQLSKQKKNDFTPRNDDLSFARVNTDPCLACCEMLEKVGDGARECLSGKNLEVLLTEVGVAFHRSVGCQRGLLPTMTRSVQPLARSSKEIPSECHRRADARQVRPHFPLLI